LLNFLSGFGKTSVCYQQNEYWSVMTGADSSCVRRDGLTVWFDGWLENRTDLLSCRLSDGAKTPSDASIFASAFLAYGDDIAHVSYGEYAAIVWDSRSRRLLALRDKAGIRPLYFARTRDGYAFSTYPGALTALADVGDEYDEKGLGEFLCGYEHTHSDTLYKNVKRIRGGHTMTWSHGRPHRTHRYWKPSTAIYGGSESAFTEEVRATIENSVLAATHGQKNIGCEVSGGVDSSTVAVTIAQLVTDGRISSSIAINGHALIYPGHECDESMQINAIANVLPFPVTRHTYQHTSMEQQRAATIKLRYPVRLLDSAQRDNSLCKSGLRVLLTGHGGDELFYPTVNAVRKGLFSLQDRSATTEYLRQIFVRDAETTPLIARCRSVAREVVSPHLLALYRSIGLHARTVRPINLAWSQAINLPRVFTPSAPHRAARTLAADIALSGHLSALHEWFAMNTTPHGFEYRHPLCSAKLIELANSAPIGMMDRFTPRSRWPMREGYARLLPNEILYRTDKADFSATTMAALKPLWAQMHANTTQHTQSHGGRQRTDRRFRPMLNGQSIWEPLAALAAQLWLAAGLASHKEGIPALERDSIR
jgi:asparagine synthase (glutamine-hydrolysing)